jgi:CheY-like chemotaxis protein
MRRSRNTAGKRAAQITFRPECGTAASALYGNSQHACAHPDPECFVSKVMSRIAIYEEDDLMRALLGEWLSEAGYRVREISAPTVERGGADDLVIVSVYMPKQGGAQLLREVQAAHPGTPLIAISAQFRSGLPAAGPAAELLRVQRVLAKPLSRTDLLEAVRGIIGPSS